MIEINQLLAVLSIIVSIGGLIIYAWFVRKQTDIMKEQALVMQESEWIPEAFFQASAGQIGFRGKRPWFPEFKAEVNGNETNWIENHFMPVAEEDTDVGIDWMTVIPDEITGFLRSFGEGKHKGELHLRFESFTGEEYQITYDIHFTNSDSECEITHYPAMSRILPWEEG